MSQSYEPFLVAIDSFVLNDITKDYFHDDPTKNQKAEEFFNEFYMRGAVPVLTWHHIEEILAHKNDEISAKSIAFIRDLPHLALVINSHDPDFIGSILDIESIEIAKILQHESTDLAFIISSTKKEMYSFASGIDFIDSLSPILETLRQKVLSEINRHKEIASISRATTLKGNRQHKLSEVKNMKEYRYSKKETEAKLDDMKKKLIQELKSNGDKKMVDIEKIADEFISKIKLENISKIPMIDMIKENSEATDEEFENIKNWEDLECISIFRGRLKSISTFFSKSEQNRILNLKEKNCPTWLLWKELYKIRTKAQRASGSDINDGFLAGLCLYTDLTIVDKRTHEYLTQIKRKSNLLKEHIGRFEKLSHYSQLLDYLPKKQ